MNVKEFCNFLNISEPTIYNWRTDKPNLYKIVMEYKKEKIDNADNLSEMLKYFIGFCHTTPKCPRCKHLSEVASLATSRVVNAKYFYFML